MSGAGDCIPPHIDHHDFVRPFVTVSLQSEQEILFSERIISLDAGVFSGRFKMPLPPGEHLSDWCKENVADTSVDFAVQRIAAGVVVTTPGNIVLN